MKIMVTGANGFIGKSICDLLDDSATRLIKVVRRPQNINEIGVGEIDCNTVWRKALEGVDVVVHTAARVHVMNDYVDDPLSEFRKVNVEGTLNIARQAAAANVNRFIFISSIKVNGESTTLGKPFTADDQPNPADSYGISKCESEVGLRNLAEESGMEVVIIRPPLVYGPGVKANFLSMMRWVKRGVPLPLGAIHNKRSLVAIDNLVDLIKACIEHPRAANQIFLAGDGEDLSTTELLLRIGKALGKPARLAPFPVSLLTFVASLLGKTDVAQRLCGSLQVDISKARTLIGWEPPISVDEGLRRTVENFKR